jgi:hypothetical protein
MIDTDTAALGGVEHYQIAGFDIGCRDADSGMPGIETVEVNERFQPPTHRPQVVQAREPLEVREPRVKQSGNSEHPRPQGAGPILDVEPSACRSKRSCQRVWDAVARPELTQTINSIMFSVAPNQRCIDGAD